MTNQNDPDEAVTNNNTKRPLTAQEETAAANLRRIWDREKCGEKRLVQKKAAEALGVKQAMISHYLNGVTPLGIVAIMEFSLFLDVLPTDIDPQFKYASLVPGNLSPEAVEVAVGWTVLPAAMKNSFRELILSAGSEAA